MSSVKTQPPVITREDIDAFFEQAFGAGAKSLPEITHLADGEVSLRLPIQKRHLRPPNFIAGPTQMGLADHAAYLAVFTRAGITPMALTSNLNINFLRPCQGEALVAEARTLKYGRSGVVVEVVMRGEGQEKDASHAAVTYVLPKAD